MLSARLLRFSAVCGIAAGLFIAIPGAIEGFAGKMHATSFIIALSPAVAAPLLLALYQRQHHAAGRFGEIAFMANLIGLGFLGGAAFTQDTALVYLSKHVVSHLKHGPTIIALVGGAAVFAVGSILFGISMLRGKTFPRVPAWGYTVIVPLFGAAAPLPESPLKAVLHSLTGLTLIWLSAVTWSASARSDAVPLRVTHQPGAVSTSN
jgi:hypothetical protein